MSDDRQNAESAGRRIDPITASVIQGALESIAVEMGYKLMSISCLRCEIPAKPDIRCGT